MQGFILSVKPANNEDIWVDILTSQEILHLYRFYGIRHSTISVGFKIDFLVDIQNARNIPRLREVLHLGFVWERDHLKRHLWQGFLRLLFLHLRGVEVIDSFYYELLELSTKRLVRQNPKRVLVEVYVEILAFEGRIHSLEHCFICGQTLGENVAIARSFLGMCFECSPKTLSYPLLQVGRIQQLLKSKETLFLEDREVNILWEIMQGGL
ncbi:recombination protein RecO [Helicobacter monodelphidis]|uniref:recombination protein RecO n=1 Tax=Helicobacter sp. 15-1451 TaxID=2004995 RepID=UPI000DCF07DD|nr:recombination protein RecO [Helicobacter sp. 15-1451]RAX57996.1 recombination protein RecO [Helicobacter sp. 15-1451]